MRKPKTTAGQARALRMDDPAGVISLGRVLRLHTPCHRAALDVPRRPFAIEQTEDVRCKRCGRRLRVYIRNDVMSGAHARWTDLGR